MWCSGVLNYTAKVATIFETAKFFAGKFYESKKIRNFAAGIP